MRRWTEEEDVIARRYVTHYGYEHTLSILHRRGFKDRTYGALRKRCRDYLDVSPGEGPDYTRVVNIDPGDGRSRRKERFTRSTVLTTAKRDGVLKYAPAGPNRMIPYVPLQWADAYVEKLNEESSEGRAAIRKRWWGTKRLAAEFDVGLKTVYQQLPFVHGWRTRRHRGHRLSCRPYLEAIPRVRIGNTLFWEPERARVMASAFQRRVPPEQVA